MNNLHLRPIPHRINLALLGQPEIRSYIESLRSDIEELQKEIEWKDKVIELALRSELEAKQAATEAAAQLQALQKGRDNT